MNWYCVQTKALKEAQAAAHLNRKLGLETYYPRLKLQKTIRRIRRVVVKPLFPRYFFCRFDLSHSYRAVRFAPEVIDVVSSGSKPTAVGNSIIEELKGWADGAVDVITLRPGLQPGDRVQINDGPMRGFQAIVLHARSDRERVAILLSLLECEAQISISHSQISRVP